MVEAVVDEVGLVFVREEDSGVWTCLTRALHGAPDGIGNPDEYAELCCAPNGAVYGITDDISETDDDALEALELTLGVMV